MSTKFITFLGTTDYKEVNYEINCKVYRTRFVQEAILNEIKLKENGKIYTYVIATEMSKEKLG